MRQLALFKKRKKSRAGRPKSGLRASERHEVRPELKAREPVHVVIRATEKISNLRRRHIFHAIRNAMRARFFGEEQFRIVHLSIQRTHVHMLVEAEDRMALARGMQGFQISAAKHINAFAKRKGTVFPDRYHARIIRTPREARNALAYVLNNWRKHREHLATFARGWRIDPFSSATRFDGWRGIGHAREEMPEEYASLPVWTPRTWLLRTGWRIYGDIAPGEMPGGGRRELAE